MKRRMSKAKDCLLDGQECFFSPGGPNGHCQLCGRAMEWGAELDHIGIAIIHGGHTLSKGRAAIDQAEELQGERDGLVFRNRELEKVLAESQQLQFELEAKKREVQELRAQMRMLTASLAEAEGEIKDLLEINAFLMAGKGILPLLREGGVRSNGMIL